MGTARELGRIAVAMGEVRWVPLIFLPETHRPYAASWTAKVLRAGILWGVHMPPEWPPGCGVLSLSRRGGDDGDEAYACGVAPLKSLELLQVWCTPGESIRLTLRLPEHVRAAELMARTDLRPYSPQVLALENGTEKTGWISTKMGT